MVGGGLLRGYTPICRREQVNSDRIQFGDGLFEVDEPWRAMVRLPAWSSATCCGTAGSPAKSEVPQTHTKEGGPMEQEVGGAIGGIIGLLMVAVVGLVIGVVAKLLMPGKDPGGWFLTILLGIAGSWVGSFVLSLLGVVGTVPALVGAVAGAMAILGVYRLATRSS